jgi:hypothetical protein
MMMADIEEVEFRDVVADVAEVVVAVVVAVVEEGSTSPNNSMLVIQVAQ